MSYKASAHTERQRSLRAPLPAKLHGGRGRSTGYVHKHSLPTPEEASERYAHGTLARYQLGKCRCLPCGVASSEYHARLRDAKRGPWRLERAEEPKRWSVRNALTGAQHGPLAYDDARKLYSRLNAARRQQAPTDLVPLTRARKHLIALRDAGLGVKSISKQAHIAGSVIDRMLRGMILRTRRSTEARILAVKIAPDRTFGRDIPAAPTLAMLEALIAVGYRKGWIAKELGAKHPVLQIATRGREFVRADKARLVKELYERLLATDPRLRAHVGVPDVDEIPASMPLSKRDPAIKKRWDALFSESMAAL